MQRSPDWMAKQVDYYRSRAGEYEATATPPGDPLADQKTVLVDALRAFYPRGRVLEIACGTGLYTRELVQFASSITAIDASPEMLDLARQRIRSPSVRFVHADVFSWEPDGQYDVVFFSFWLSHVPPTHFERFWDRVAAFLAPNGRVFFMDEGPHSYWREEFVDEVAGVVRRQLLDGSEHFAIKVLWDASDLERRLRDLGWDITVHRTDAFYWGHGGRAAR
jgi:demethylmenaquinone methyltransferase/2-methoxy-6-polyprenyl-1,4-benzoquinol methylase